MRWLCVAAAAALAAGPAGAWPGDPKPPRLGADAWSGAKAWLAEHIDQNGWIVADGAGHLIWFVSAAPMEAPDYPVVRDWVRGEYADPQKSHSFLWRLEVNCSDRRQRITEGYSYRDNNLRGPFILQPSQSDWQAAPAKGTVMLSVVDAICRGARR